MGFNFTWLCELLEDLEKNKYQQRATYSRHEDPNHRLIHNWYQKHTGNISRSGPSAIAFLSCIFPEKRPDRTYNLQQKRLTQILGRILGLGTNRLRVLESWQTEGGQDFPTCLERTMQECEFEEPPSHQQVTLEEIDIALTRIAANNIASAPAIRAQANGEHSIDILAPIFRRLQSAQAKWLVRMIMKSYNPIEIPEYATLYGFHFLLPKLLVMQNSFEAAVEIVSRPELIQIPPRPSKEYEAALLPILAKELKPRLGVMIRRQPFDKARSIKHCVKIASSRTMSVERKYDGEYCQIHIDNSRGQGTIQIFSKSGKDSTQDRIGLLGVIKAGLKLRTPECKIKSKAILEGELLIYSRSDRDVLPFHHIRKHVLHGGRRIGTQMDSPKKVGEHLMIAFFDVLLLNDKVMLSEPHRVRRAHLKGLVTPIEGEVRIVERIMIDFSSSRAKDSLVQSFSHAIRLRWEGFVLKGLEDPYYSWKQDVRGMRTVKLKKDYIAGLGDSADLCIVGGHRDPKIETKLNIGRLSWTAFHVACLTNKMQVQRYDARPAFKIIDCLGPGSMSKDDILALNTEGRLVEKAYVFDSEHMLIKNVRGDIPLPISIYTKPMVVEIFGAGYERPQTADFYILRFPRRVGTRIKIHKDRDIADTVDFDELQSMAEQSLKEAEDFASQEEIEWMERLLAADPKSKYLPDKSQSTSPSKTQHSATTASLTPVGHQWASTQPSPVFVRIDTGELTPTELSERYPDSAPQTPSRRSDSTTSPSTTRTREVSRRDFAVENSPTPPSRKRKRVAFEPTNRITNPRSMSDMTEMSRRENVKRQEKADEWSTMPPPGQNKQNTKSKTEQASNDSSNETSTNNTHLSTSNSESNSQSTKEPPAAPTVKHTETRSHEIQSVAPSLGHSATARLPAWFILSNLTITHPIFLTSSLGHANHSNTNQTTTLISTLKSQKLSHTAHPNTFLRHVFPTPVQPAISTSSNLLPIILINTDDAPGASRDIKTLINNMELPAPEYRPTVGHPVRRDIVVFDYRVVGTIFWEAVVRRTQHNENWISRDEIGNGNGNGNGRAERAEEGGDDSDRNGKRGNTDAAEGEDEGEDGEAGWKKWFCGRLEIGIAVAEEAEAVNGEVQYNSYGEMFWE